MWKKIEGGLEKWYGDASEKEDEDAVEGMELTGDWMKDISSAKEKVTWFIIASEMNVKKAWQERRVKKGND